MKKQENVNIKVSDKAKRKYWFIIGALFGQILTIGIGYFSVQDIMASERRDVIWKVQDAASASYSATGRVYRYSDCREAVSHFYENFNERLKKVDSSFIK